MTARISQADALKLFDKYSKTLGACRQVEYKDYSRCQCKPKCKVVETKTCIDYAIDAIKYLADKEARDCGKPVFIPYPYSYCSGKIFEITDCQVEISAPCSCEKCKQGEKCKGKDEDTEEKPTSIDLDTPLPNTQPPNMP